VDIVYSDSERIAKELGVLTEYSLDLAFGQDENSFSLTMPLRSRDIKYGSYIYQTGTEYGGIVDKMKVDTANRQIIYSGRTWHGILASKIIEPDAGADYLLVSGDANEIIGQLIERAGLSDIFIVDPESAIHEIDNYQIRYGNLYAVLVEMLYSFGYKLKIEHDYIEFEPGTQYSYYEWRVKLSAVSNIDYASDEAWNSSQRDFTAEQNNRPINHMVCLGSGQLKNRHVIHLFSDGVNIMPYVKSNLVMYIDVRRNIATNIKVSQVVNSTSELPAESTDNTYVGILSGEVYQWYDDGWHEVINHFLLNPSLEVIDKPIKDDDYILDKTAIQFIGIDENAIVFDYPNAETVSNYIPLNTEPADWNQINWERNEKYYKYSPSDDSEDNYQAIKGEESKAYKIIPTKPADWDTNVDKYYARFDREYKKIDFINIDNFTLLHSSDVPDWTTTYRQYYEKQGVEYINVKAITVTQYAQADITAAQNEWTYNYGNYYTRHWDGTSYIYTAVPAASKSMYVVQQSVPDDWNANYGNYYHRTATGDYVKVPGETKKVKKKTVTVAPTWYANRYYTKVDYSTYPPFSYKAGDLWKPYQTVTAPPFAENKYYDKSATPVAPEFEANKYYTEVITYVAPLFSPKTVYIRHQDHYANLVESAIKRFKEYLNCDKINISLRPSEQYDIGDVVGATDDVTGLTVIKPITKKIVKISRDRTSISYETGGMGL
jgi:hypothetical protein